MNLQKQLRCVYLHAFTSTLRFTDAVWVALLAARGFTRGGPETGAHVNPTAFPYPHP
jgi:hypothetical protein